MKRRGLFGWLLGFAFVRPLRTYKGIFNPRIFDPAIFDTGER
jgi:hypothetical protein